MLERQKRINFLPEMQSKVTTNCDNFSGTEYEMWGLGEYILKKVTKRREIWVKVSNTPGADNCHFYHL